MITTLIPHWIEHKQSKFGVRHVLYDINQEYPSTICYPSGVNNASQAAANVRPKIKKIRFKFAAPSRQVSPANPVRERPPMPEAGTSIAHSRNDSFQVSYASQNIAYLPFLVRSKLRQLLNPSLHFISSFLLRSYVHILGQVVDFLRGLNLYEPPLSAHCVRLRWICVSFTRPQITAMV